MSNYSKNKLVADENNAWHAVFALVNKNEKVLDIGCSSGNFGRELIDKKGCTVDGIDVNKADVQKAKRQLRHAYVLNIEHDSLAVLKDRYDAILMMDVIEHLVEPAAALEKVAKLLKPGGRLIFSVPNMAHVSVRLDLLLGNLDYRQVGLLDSTHLHFYTEKGLRDVLYNAGYSIEVTNSITVTYPRQLIDLKLKEAGLKSSTAFNEAIARTKGNVYQFIGVAKPARGTRKKASFPATNPHEAHYKQIETAIDEQSKLITTLRKELTLKDQHIANLEARIAQLTSGFRHRLATSARSSLHRGGKDKDR